MDRRLSWALLLSLVFPGCIIYDAELLANADGANASGGASSGGSASGSGGDGMTGGQGSDIIDGSGGEFSGAGGNGTGGEIIGSGGDGSGGTPSGSGGSATGGTTGSGGGGSGCGKSSITMSSFQVVDDFNNSLNYLNSSPTAYSGSWYVNGAGGSGLSPTSAGLGEAFPKEADACFSAGDKTLHVTGAGYTWASADATLFSDAKAIDVSAYTKVALWARTGESLQRVAIGLTYEDDSTWLSTYQTVESSWGIPLTFNLPAEVSSKKVKVIKIALTNDTNYDVWFDDLTLYKP